MITVEVLDKKYARYQTRVAKTAHWLMKKFKKGGFCLEIALLPTRIMPRNVYSFGAKAKFPRPDLRKPPLGEIYLNPDVARRQGWTIEYLLIHGFLHLLGYDHVQERDRISMERLEQKLLKQISKF